MSEIVTQKKIKSVTWEAVVHRANGDVEELGVIDSWHAPDEPAEPTGLQRLINRFKRS